MIERREFMKFAVAGAGLALLPVTRAADINNELSSSDLIYLTPIKTNGQESACQAEIWYVWDGKHIYVCTDTSAWRARAPTLGLDRTRIWVGDLGNWKGTKGKYKGLPKIDAATSIVLDPAIHATALEMFASKYPIGWIRWGTTFTNGLKTGSRTLLKYRPLAA